MKLLKELNQIKNILLKRINIRNEYERMRKSLLLIIILLVFITGCVSKKDRKYADELATDFIQNDLGLKNTKAKMSKVLADEGGSVRMSNLAEMI